MKALSLPKFKTYEQMVSDRKWVNGLKSLNKHLRISLEEAGREVCLNGNLFYAHKDTEFESAELVPQFENKRRNFFHLAMASNHMFEVGVNGGHSLYLALSANPKLHVVGVDICRMLHESWAPVDVYVPAAFEWLEAAFPKRTKFITGNSLIEVPRYAEENSNPHIDLLHLDGAKDTHLREFLGMRDCLTAGALVVLDDTNTRPVRFGMRQMLKLNLARHLGDNEIGVEMAMGHRVLINQ